MNSYISKCISTIAWERDQYQEKKEREQAIREYNAYWDERERWDSWEERGFLVGCPYGNPDERGRDMDDGYYWSEFMIDEDSTPQEKEAAYKRPRMSDDRIAHRAELLQKYLEKSKK